MKKLITILLSGFLIVSFSNVYAATTSKKTATTTKPDIKVVTVATVNIYSAKSTKINETQYTVSFDIFNRVGIQSNIRYGVQLVNADKYEILDTQLVNESLTLKEKETKSVSINYTVPGFVPAGNYKLVVVAQNQNGLPLAFMPVTAGDTMIKIESNSQSIAINNCILTILNDASSTAKYNNIQGADIMPEEKLIATCDVINSGSTNQNNIKLQLITHKKSSFGDILSNDTLTEVVSVKGDTTQSISFQIPTLKNSQLYFVDTFFVNSDGQKVSPSYPIYYSIHGYTATINNLTLNAKSFKKGDVANLNVFWTIGGGGVRIPPNKDTYVIKAEIKNSLKNVCGSTAKTTNNPSTVMNNTLFNIAITQNCIPAIATVSIYDGKGSLLDTTEIDSQNPVNPININANIQSIKNISAIFGGSYKYYAVLFIIVLVLIGYGIVVLRKKEQENKNNQ